MRNIQVLVLLPALLLASPGQSPNTTLHNGQPQNVESSQTTLRVTTELVLVPVVVTDSSGKPVTGLKREDFTIYADGKRQTIAKFDEVQVTSVAGNSESHPNEYSNYVTDSKTSARPVIVVIDLLNSASTDQWQARNEILRFLDTQLQPNQPVELFFLTSKGLRLVQSFTNSALDLRAAVLKLQQRTSYEEQNNDERKQVAGYAADLPTQLPGVTQLIQSMFLETDYAAGARQRDAITTTLNAMAAVATGFSGIPGRKNLIWLTAGFPFQVTDPSALGGVSSEFVGRYQQTWQKLSDANVALYPVDVRGTFESRWNPNAADSATLAQKYSVKVPMVSVDSSVSQTLQLFASETSGKVCKSNNDLSKCLTAAAQDGANNYTLSFYAGPEIRKNGWHKLKVVVDKQPGLKIHSRAGFFAGDEKPPIANEQPEKAVLAAVRSPVPVTALPFSVRWMRQGETSVVNRGARLTKNTYNLAATGAVFRISFPPYAFAVDSGDTNRMQLDVAAVAIDTEGKPAGDFSQLVTAHLTPEVLAKIETSGFSYTDAIALPKGSFEVRFIVRDAVSGKVGSVEAPIRVVP